MTSLILFALAASVNASMDMNFNMYHSSVFQNFKGLFWNPNESWSLKWKNGDRSQGERFFLSSTLLVWLFDYWHLAKLIFIGLIIGSIYFYNDYIYLYPLIWFVFFELTKKLLTLKK